MRHYKKGRKLGTDASHTKAIKKNLCVALFKNDRIKTTLERAKEIRGDVDRVITWAKRGDVHSRRLAIAKLGDKDLVREVFSKVEQGLFKDRPGGYSRILKIGTRRGDSAVIVIMQLVTEQYVAKEKKKDGKAVEKTDAPAPKKSSEPSADADVLEAVVESEETEEELEETDAVPETEADEPEAVEDEGSEVKAEPEGAEEGADEPENKPADA
jgi:large subunit ribosomal protein L17